MYVHIHVEYNGGRVEVMGHIERSKSVGMSIEVQSITSPDEWNGDRNQLKQNSRK